MRIDLLCSGSKGNCCVIRNDQGGQLVIDCGSTKRYLVNSFNKINAKIDDTDGVLITHAHSDHISQLKHFKHLDVYSYCELKDCMDKHDIYPDQTFNIEAFKITVLELSHDAPCTIGFVIECDNEKLVYITDTGYLPNRIKSRICDATYYIFESNHDIDMLMQTQRPMYLKRRILSDSGHLNNIDASMNLINLINMHTKEIIFAHLSQEANTHDLPLDTFHDSLLKNDLHLKNIEVKAAEQFEIMTIGKDIIC